MSPIFYSIINYIYIIIKPIIVSFVIAYALNPFVNKLKSKGLSKGISIFIVISIIITIIIILISMILPLLFNELSTLYKNILIIINDNSYLKTIINNIYINLSKNIFNILSKSINTFSNFFISAFLAFYMLYMMDKIKEILRNTKYYNYLKCIDIELNKYIEGFIKIIGITLIEYIFAFTIIGHPNSLLLGTLASFSNIIPFFGGLLTNVIALITAYFISPNLFIRTIIIGIILSIIDSYIINPFVYGKSNSLPPLVVIIAIYIGSSVFGILGLIMCLPLTIIVITTYKYYKNMI